MTLTNALRSASSALAGNARQASVLARNISGVGDPNYVKRDAVVTTQLYGTIRVEIQRNVQHSLYNGSITANADAAKANIVSNGIDELAFAQGIDDFAYSPAGLINKLRESLSFAASAPSDDAGLSSIVENGRILASSLNVSYSNVLDMRASMDQEINNSVNELNSLLADLKTINDDIVNGTKIGEDVLDRIDMRDQLVSKMSEHLSLKILPRQDNDIFISTTNGLLLFEKSPRSVSFQHTPSYGATTPGHALYIDGVQASGDEPWQPVTSGRIGGYFELRDEVLVSQQKQLDEISRSLIDTFGEQDKSVSASKPKLAGLFSWSGDPSIPDSASLEPGISETIRINALVDTQSSGNPRLIRDGAINGDSDYNYNLTGGSGFSDRLMELVSAFDEISTFDASAGLPVSQSIIGFSSSSLDWLNSQRQTAQNSATYLSELSQQFIHAYQSESGTNIDTEMSKLLEVERAYQASAKILTVIDEMFATLFSSVRV